MSSPTPTTAVSSSSTIWATPSKEWVIPAKPKPGRKPKKDAAPVVAEDGEVDAKGRRVQNRAAQRAFRERKQSQLAELQARVQQYEQGEIERNVALQNIAKRLKEENEKLRRENASLKEKLAHVEDERDALREASRKRLREDSVPCSPDGLDYPSRKRNRVASDSFFSTNIVPVSTPYTSSPSSVASSPNSNGHTSFSPMPLLPPPRDMPIFPQGNALSNIFDFISTGKTSVFEPGGALENFDCGFCNENTPCVCRELALQTVGERMAGALVTSPKLESLEPRSALGLDPMPQLSSPITIQSSILDNLPAYQPPVPLRRRAAPSGANSVFPVTQSSAHAPPIATCTGDPSNCLACADDPFGKAFCDAISKTVSSNSNCENCSCSASSSSQKSYSTQKPGCCGNPAACGRGQDSVRSAPTLTESSTAPQLQDTSVGASTADTISCDDAWRQIKSHPNVGFADLTLLAEVVARRTKCTGPRVEIHPAPGTLSPERDFLPPSSSEPPRPSESEIQQVILTDPHARYRELQREHNAASSPAPQLVPQEILIQCGRRRVREVQADNVREALRLLDAKFSMS